MLKKTIVFILIAFITGCTAEYNLTIDEGFHEKIIIDGSAYSEKYLSLYSEAQSINYSIDEIQTDNFYKVQNISLNGKNMIQYSYDFDYVTISDSNAIRNSYKYFSLKDEDEIVSIVTSNEFYGFLQNDDLSNMTINIITDYEVLQNNADKVSGNKYTWNITKENQDKKSIIFKYNKISNEKSKKNIITYLTDNIYFVIFIILIIIVGLLVTFIIKFIGKNRNKV